MKKALKRILLILLVLILLIAGSLGLITTVLQDEVGNTIIAEINKQIKSELTVNKVELTVFSSFPNASADLRGVVLMDNRDGVLLEADKLAFRMSLLSLLGKKILIKSIAAENGALTVHLDRRGNPNYDIFRPADDNDADTSDRIIDLESATFRNIELIYSDESKNTVVYALVKHADFSGAFSAEKFSLSSKADIATRFAEQDGLRYLAGKSIQYDARVAVNLREKVYTMENVVLDIESNRFKVDGKVEMWKEGPYFDLRLDAEKGSVASVIQFLPESYQSAFGDFRSSGKFFFNAAIKGLYSPRLDPGVQASFRLEEGRIESPRLSNPIQEVSFSARFSNGKFRDRQGAVFAIEDFKGYFNRELLELKLRAENLNDPVVDFQFDGVLPMNSVYGLFGNPGISAGDGEVEIKNLTVAGRYEDMLNPSRIASVKLGGELEFDDAALVINGEKMLLDRGNVKIEGNLLVFSDIKLDGAGSDILLNGTAFNVLPVLFSDSLNTNEAALEFRATLMSSNLDIDRLMAISAVTADSNQVGRETFDSLKVAQNLRRERISRLLEGVFDARIARFNYGKIEGANFSGKLELAGNELIIRGAADAMKGAFDLDGTITLEGKPYLRTRLKAKNVDITEFFRQCDDFGQSMLQSKHIKGRLDAQIAIYVYWDETGSFLGERLRVLGDINISSGELNRFEMLENFSSFVNVNDLRQIRFTRLQNFFSVRNRTLYLPAMFIQSNALNLTVGGEHSFDNKFRYNLKVNAGQVLAERLKSHDPGLSPKKARQNGWFNLYYTIFGTPEDYQFKSDKRQVRSDFEQSIERRRAIESALAAEFGAFSSIREPEGWGDAE